LLNDFDGVGFLAGENLGGIMKTNLMILGFSIFAIAGCESWYSAVDKARDTPDTVIKEPAGSQSHSSDVNAASSSQKVGQSGTFTNQYDFPRNP